MCEGNCVGLQIRLIRRVTLTIVVLVVWDLFCGSSEESLEFVLSHTQIFLMTHFKLLESHLSSHTDDSLFQ